MERPSDPRTHSLAFIDLPGKATVYELTRDCDQSHAHRIDADQLTPQAQLIRELGLDRGELLSRHNAFLFTETAQLADEISQRHGEALSNAHIDVRPLTTTASHHGLGQLELLLEVTGLTIAVALTTVTSADIQHSRTASGTEREALLRRDDSIATVARLVALELRHERRLVLLALDDPADIIDALWQIEQQTVASER